MDKKSLETRIVEKVSSVSGQTPHGVEIHGTLLRVTLHTAAFEFYDSQVVLRTSEVLERFRVMINDRPVYAGRAVVTKLLVTGSTLLCEVNLEVGGFVAELFASPGHADYWASEFSEFIQSWQKNYCVLPEYKVAIADLQTFLADLRIWLEQVEVAERSSSSGDRLQREQEVAQGLAAPFIPPLTTLFEKAENVTLRLTPDEQPAHRSFMQRQLHPLVLCAPFVHRSYFKPLGYAGDYEMVNMITRNPCEGGSLFAKVVNAWFLAQPPAEAHRNRLDYLVQKLTEETARVSAEGRSARIFNLGCGPSVEIQRFLQEKEFADRASFTLVDFNEETLDYAREVLQTARQQARRSTPLQFFRKSVNQLLKDTAAGIEVGGANQYDLVYCAGLTDYLSDAVCQRVINLLYSWVAPGGLLLITNVDGSNPRHKTMEYVLEWHLNYRSASRLAALKPASVPADCVKVCSDLTGVNNYLEVRKLCHV